MSNALSQILPTGRICRLIRQGKLARNSKTEIIVSAAKLFRANGNISGVRDSRNKYWKKPLWRLFQPPTFYHQSCVPCVCEELSTTLTATLQKYLLGRKFRASVFILTPLYTQVDWKPKLRRYLLRWT